MLSDDELKSINNADDMSDLINETETKIFELKEYLVKLESNLEEIEEFDRKCDLEIASHQYGY